MRVQVIIPDRLNSPVGGVGVQLKEIMAKLPEVDWDIIGMPADKDTENYKGVLNPLPNIPHTSLITFGGQIAYFAEAIKHQKPDIVHAYDWSTYFSGYYTAKHFGVPLVCTMQLSKTLLSQNGINYADVNTIDGHWLEACHQEVEKTVLMNCDHIIQVSNWYAAQFKGTEAKTTVIPNGINLDEWKQANAQTITDLDTNYIDAVYIGRFSNMKGVLSLLKSKIPKGINLRFIGKEEGGDANVIQEMAKKGIKYEPKYGQDKIDAMCASDIVIMPSIHEPFGIVALESFASRCILLTSQHNGLSDFCNDDNSINCGTTPQSIENALYRYLAMTQEEKYTMIANGLKVCGQYTWRKAADMTLKVYKNTIKTL